MRLVLALALLAGCDRFLSVEPIRTRVPDAGGDGYACTPSRDDTMDEDCDGLADAVDPCPADVEQTDIDGDHVGDVCDPDTAAADHIVLFDGFRTLSSAWQTSSGTWSVDAGVLGNNDVDGVITQPISTYRYLVESHVFVNTFGTNPLVVVGVTDASANGYECRIYPEAGGVKVQASIQPASGTPGMGPVKELLGTGFVRVQVVQESGNLLSCRAQYSTTNFTSSSLGSSSTVMATSVVLSTSSADALFDSVTVTGI